MKRFLVLFILYYYESFVQIDWSCITPAGRIYYVGSAFIRGVLLWIISPIFIPMFLIIKSKRYQEFIKQMENAHLDLMNKTLKKQISLNKKYK